MRSSLSLVLLLGFFSFALCQPADPGWKGTLDPSCKCWAARFKYWQLDPGVKSISYDPVYHYLSAGYNDGHTWPDCSICAPETNPVYWNDPVCNCPAAANYYANTFSWMHQTPETAFSFWVQNIGIPPAADGSSPSSGLMWPCDLCNITGPSNTQAPTPTPKPTGVPHEQTCIAARDEYLAINTDVDGAYLDPVYHYNNAIKNGEGRVWYPELCQTNPIYPDVIYPDTNTVVNCTNAAQRFLDKYGVWFTDLTIATAYQYWIDNYLKNGVRWEYNLCKDTSSTSATTAATTDATTASSATSATSATTATTATTATSSTTKAATTTTGTNTVAPTNPATHAPTNPPSSTIGNGDNLNGNSSGTSVIASMIVLFMSLCVYL